MKMKKRKSLKRLFCICALIAFVAWTVLVRFLDRSDIGPEGSVVGFSAMNGFFHRWTGINMTLYHVTDWLGILPLCIVLGFAMLGLVQWIKRKSFRSVDRDLFVLGGFYLLVMAVFLFFEFAVINYRPILIEGVLEASYPSSTTMLSLCVMPTAAMQLKARIRRRFLSHFCCVLMISFSVFMVIGRLLSGVHWLSDIFGGVLLSAGLVSLYSFVIDIVKKNDRE